MVVNVELEAETEGDERNQWSFALTADRRAMKEDHPQTVRHPHGHSHHWLARTNWAEPCNVAIVSMQLIGQKHSVSEMPTFYALSGM